MQSNDYISKLKIGIIKELQKQGLLNKIEVDGIIDKIKQRKEAGVQGN